MLINMNNEGKCIEYYFDSKTFTKEQLLKNIEEAKLEFPNKKIEPKLYLNQWGVYILKINFKDKIEYISDFKEKRKNKKILLLTEKNKKVSEKRTAWINRSYGQYKNTRDYRPL